MYTIGLILIAFLVGSSSALPIDFGLPSSIPYDFDQPFVRSDLSRALLPASQLRNVYPAGYLNPAVVDSDLVSPVSSDLVYNYPYAAPKRVNMARENYVRDYPYGGREVGSRDVVSVRSNVPTIARPYSRVCAYFPVGTCARGINRYPPLAVDYDIPTL